MSEDYTATTEDVQVSVRAFFLPDRSKPDEGWFFWAYRVRIANKGQRRVQLLARTWQVTDAAGRSQTVHGEGVIGQTPVIAPGETFEYTSGTPLNAPSGFMYGHYHMKDPDSGATFAVRIPPFSLDSPHQSIRVH